MDKLFIPPLKIQGIKSKIVPLIKSNVKIDDNTTWIEPFMGSGVVGFNIARKYAIFADSNPHIINFYNSIKDGSITPYNTRLFLEHEGNLLSQKDEEHYYEIRDRFNKFHAPLDYLFLNRSCFNGMMRFNKYNEFNVPYGHKPHRFAKAYVTKIVNQIEHVRHIIITNQWTFLCQTFEETISNAEKNSFIYCDPPYIGRHVDYYDSWDECNEFTLHKFLQESNSNYMLSTWDHNDYRKNEYIDTLWEECHKITCNHYYHLGAKETNRNSIVEALLTNYITNTTANTISDYHKQTILFDD